MAYGLGFGLAYDGLRFGKASPERCRTQESDKNFRESNAPLALAGKPGPRKSVTAHGYTRVRGAASCKVLRP